MPSIKDIAWAAGIIEGEGCIAAYPKWNQIKLAVEMCDLDVLQKLAAILGTDCRLTKRKVKKLNPKHRDRYILLLCGPAFVGWMLTIYPLLGIRRQAKVRLAIKIFKARKHRAWVATPRKLQLTTAIPL